MHLLGLHPSLCEEKYQVNFEKDMFEHMNKKGSEAVLHFLFTELDPHQSNEVFRWVCQAQSARLRQLWCCE